MAVIWTAADLHPGLAKFTTVDTAGEHSQCLQKISGTPQTAAGHKMGFEI